MTRGLAAINALRRISASLAAGELPPESDRQGFSAALAAYEAAPAQGMAAAFGLRPGPGEAGWWTLEARQRRDALLARWAAEHYPDLSARAAADAIERRLARYETTAWRRDRDRSESPHQTGSERDFAWHVLTTAGATPRSRAIRAAISAAGDDMPANDDADGETGQTTTYVACPAAESSSK